MYIPKLSFNNLTVTPDKLKTLLLNLSTDIISGDLKLA